MGTELLTFTGVAALLTITPGPDMAIVTRNALAHGWRAGARTAFGIIAGLLGWAIASGAGLAAVLQASAEAFTAVKLAGAAYLVLLGAQAIGRSLGGSGAAMSAPDSGARRGSPLRQGFVVNALNPKIGVFYTAVLPQFIDAGEPVLAWSLALAAIHATLSLVWLVGYARAVGGAGSLLRRPPARAMLERITGGVLVALGLRLALERR